MGAGKDRFLGNKLGMVRHSEEPSGKKKKKGSCAKNKSIEPCRELLSLGLRLDLFIDTYLSDMGRHTVPTQADSREPLRTSTEDKGSKDETLKKRSENGSVG